VGDNLTALHNRSLTAEIEFRDRIKFTRKCEALEKRKKEKERGLVLYRTSIKPKDPSKYLFFQKLMTRKVYLQVWGF
jgi:hypothetical protein